MEAAEIRRIWKFYGGRLLFVREASGSGAVGISGRWKYKLIEVPMTGTKVEVLPIAGGHKKTEWKDASTLAWWIAQCKQYHPDWDQQHATVPEVEEAGGPWYITNERAFWSGQNNGMAPSLNQATPYEDHGYAQRALKRLGKRIANLRIVDQDTAEVVAQKIPEVEEELAIEATLLEELAKTTPAEIEHGSPDEVEVQENEMPQPRPKKAPSGAKATGDLRGAYRGLMTAWTLYAEEHTRFLKELGRALGMDKEDDDG